MTRAELDSAAGDILHPINVELLQRAPIRWLGRTADKPQWQAAEQPEQDRRQDLASCRKKPLRRKFTILAIARHGPLRQASGLLYVLDLPRQVISCTG